MSSAVRTRTILVTGATSGIGREVCAQLAAAGHAVHAVGRRTDRLDAMAAHHPMVTPHAVDISDETAVDQLAERLGPVDDIVHAAGGARGSAPVLAADTTDWLWMWQTNVLGSMYLMRRIVPRLVERGHGSIVVITSVAAFQTVDGSGGYSSSKHAQSAIVQTLRNELLGTGVRVTEIAPGLVETEYFSQRFPGEPGRAAQIFDGLDPLTPADVASSVLHALDQPGHVNIDRIVLRPIAQAPNGKFHRR